MTEEMKVPTLRFPEFTGEWFEQQLGELFEFKNGINASKEDYGHGRKFINVLDIIQNDYITHEAIIGSVNVSPEDFNKYIVEHGDIVFQRSSETREEVGQANVYLDDEPATFGGFVIRGKKIANYDPYFINQLLKTEAARKEIVAKSGGSTRYNVGQEILKAVTINTTSPPEQQKIATFLAAVDERLRLLETQREELQRYKQGVMQRIFDRELRFRDENGEAFPEWEEKRLGDLAELNPKSDELPERFVYIDLESVIDGRLVKEDVINLLEAPSRAQRLLQPGDVLFQTVRPYQMNNLHFDREGKFVASTGYAQLRPYQNVKFLYHLIHSSQFVRKVLRRCTGSNYPAINSSDLSDIKLLVPKLNEQAKIADFLDKINSTYFLIEKAITSNSTWKQGILQNLFV